MLSKNKNCTYMYKHINPIDDYTKSNNKSRKVHALLNPHKENDLVYC